jgi:hypothetical protein
MGCGRQSALVENFEDHGRETFDMVIDTAMRMGKDMLLPALVEMDRQGDSRM